MSFNPRPPCGGRLGPIRAGAPLRVFQSAPSLRRATQDLAAAGMELPVSIRALPAEGDTALSTGSSCSSRFQSAPSLRRATRRPAAPTTQGRRFNPRPPCGGRRSLSRKASTSGGFQSAPSLRRATSRKARQSVPDEVSIRALPAEGDAASGSGRIPSTCFNPRPPCGGRRGGSRSDKRNLVFQSAPSLRRATKWCRRTGARSSRFNPRPPCGGRPIAPLRLARTRFWFQSAPSLRRATEDGACRR